MPVASGDFTVQNSDPQMTEKLNIALAYLQRSPTAAAFLELASQHGVQIGMNPKGADHYPDVLSADPGRDLFDPGTHMVIWNPDGAAEIKDNAGNILGVQSAALGLLHEIVHAVDPALIAHRSDNIPGYYNAAEYTAIQYESMVAKEIGEVTRDNWRGNDIVSANPTAHTMPTQGGLVWVQVNEKGMDEYGSRYDSPGKVSAGYVPVFGGTPGYDPRPGSSDNNPYAGDYSGPKGGDGSGGGEGGDGKNGDGDGNQYEPEYEPEYDPLTAGTGTGDHKLIVGKGNQNIATNGGVNGHNAIGAPGDHAAATVGQSIVFASGHHIASSSGSGVDFSADQTAGHAVIFQPVHAGVHHTAPQPFDHVAVAGNAVAIIGVATHVIDHIFGM